MTHTVALNGRFVRHYVEMVVAMVAGMLLFDPVWSLVLGGWAPLARPDVGALVMATNMTVGMSIWMRVRGHGWAPIAEMGAAMYVPFLVLFVPWWLGGISAGFLTVGGHVLMLPAMLVPMLLRRAEYTHCHSQMAVTGWKRRWPTALALLMTVEMWFHPWFPPAVAVLVMPGAYLVIGACRKRLREPGVLGTQLAGLGAYLVLVAVALAVPDDVARYLVGAGWLAHGVWDYLHHRHDKVVPRGFAEWCGVLDVVVGTTVILLV